MKAKEIHGLGYATLATDVVTNEQHFDCGDGERYTLPYGAVYCDCYVKGYQKWVAPIQAVRMAAAAQATRH